MGKYGKYAVDGSVEEEATECILTERKLDPPYSDTVRYSVKGTNMFFRILGSQHHRVTDEMLKEWRNEPAETEQESFTVTGITGKNKKGRESLNDSVIGGFGAGSEKPE